MYRLAWVRRTDLKSVARQSQAAGAIRGDLVEVRGFEPLASAMRTQRSPS
jgi:hypothetical protein